jgi:class 3 adenylate cyclase
VSTPIKRKLAAILSADVAGYSRLMGADEERTLRLLAAHRAIIDSIIALHDGRVVNTAGDSVLAEFTSPVEAVRAAGEIQDALRTRNESLPEAERMQFRIGLHLGDVMINGDDLLGDGVNVAARLQAVAEPGGICISSSIFDQVEGKLSLRFRDIGEQSLKNIARPVRAFMLHGAAGTAPERGAPRRRRRRGGVALAIGAGLVAVAAVGAYVGGLVPDFGSRARKEASAWEAVRAAREVPALEGYLAAYPDGAHAPEARERIAGLLAEARQAVEVERARLKAGEAEAARVRAEAEAARAKAEADATRKLAAGSPVPQTTAAAGIASAPGAPARSRQTRFDGTWVGEMKCPEWRGRPSADRLQRATVLNGEMTLGPPVPGRPRSFQRSGQIADDDSVELRGAGVGANGKAFELILKGRFSKDGFTAHAEPPGRPCTLQLVRE